MPKNIRTVGNNVIGDNCKIGEYVKIENCIVFDNAEIKTGAELKDCIVLPVCKELSERHTQLLKNNFTIQV